MRCKGALLAGVRSARATHSQHAAQGFHISQHGAACGPSRRGLRESRAVAPPAESSGRFAAGDEGGGRAAAAASAAAGVDSVLDAAASAGFAVGVSDNWTRGRRKGVRKESHLLELAYTLECRREGEHWEELIAGYDLRGRDFVKLLKVMCASKKGYLQAVDLFSYLKDGTDYDVRNKFAFTTMINGCARYMDEERVFQLLGEMQALDIQVGAATYNAVMKCIKDRPKRIEALMVMMREGGIECSEHTYTAYITSLGRRGMLPRALEAFEEMKEQGLAPNKYTYGAIISAIARKGDVDRAVAVFDEMLAGRIQPNEFVYSSLIHCCKVGGEWERALEIFEEMVEADEMKPDLITYTALIDTCRAAGRWEHCLRLYDRMKGDGVKPNRVTYRAVYHAVYHAPDGDEKRAALRRVEHDIIRFGAIPYKLLKEAERYA